MNRIVTIESGINSGVYAGKVNNVAVFFSGVDEGKLVNTQSSSDFIKVNGVKKAYNTTVRKTDGSVNQEVPYVANIQHANLTLLDKTTFNGYYVRGIEAVVKVHPLQGNNYAVIKKDKAAEDGLSASDLKTWLG